jgi:hypothetical protein
MDQFIAGCRPNEADENGVFPCRPKMIKGKETWTSERDVLIKLQRGRATIQDDTNLHVISKEML